ncbi:hypothetical protein EVAR_80198_1 [Eumeta japonica]|uniref:Uncharacterized protein n=1 Tax=Eumeta variegata TaxID=151549 RepID=A0A4C1UCA3_EUMVA|nr:hypothetical protein EVAR_80198_1 [Eumeta japonica]
MADNPESRKDLVKKALFGEVLKQQIEDNFSEMKTVKEKRLLTKMVAGKIVDKYKLWRMNNTGVITEMKTFVGTLKVHQVTGKFFNPMGIKSNSTEIVMKTLSCFCDNDYCVHFNIGKIIYEDKPKLNVEDVYTDSESDNEAGPSSAVVQPFKTGDYIVVKLLGKTNMEYRYVSIIDKIDEEDGEIRVTFCDNKGQLFRYDADDVSDITMDQVVQKLSNPNIVLKGNRIFYKFDLPVDVFEKK